MMTLDEAVSSLKEGNITDRDTGMIPELVKDTGNSEICQKFIGSLLAQTVTQLKPECIAAFVAVPDLQPALLMCALRAFHSGIIIGMKTERQELPADFAAPAKSEGK